MTRITIVVWTIIVQNDQLICDQTLFGLLKLRCSYVIAFLTNQGSRFSSVGNSDLGRFGPNKFGPQLFRPKWIRTLTTGQFRPWPLVNSDLFFWLIRTFSFGWFGPFSTFPLANSDLSRSFPLANSDLSRPFPLANSDLSRPFPLANSDLSRSFPLVNSDLSLCLIRGICSWCICHRGGKSTWHDRDSNPGPPAHRASTLITELPSHMVDPWQFPLLN